MLKDVSLTTVRAFEAAARHGSFRAAANDLKLSPSAISHAVLKLEQSLDVRLFEREGRHIRLSADGETLMRHVGVAFDELRRGMETVSTRGAPLLRLHAAPSFAAQWLSPRLTRFFAAHPDIEVRLASSTEYARFTNGDFDADIVYGPPRGESVTVVPLGEETVTPLCAPEVAASIRCKEDLLACVLIQSDAKLVRWPDWFERNGMSAPPPHGMRFDRSFLAIAAAADRLGVALESTRLAERELAAGRLVAPLAGLAKDVRYVGHRLVFPQTGRQPRTVRLFAEWLLRELEIEGVGLSG
ncbi:LysR substrate-binding domain-containing protein [Methylopila sp. Yamaguchi]|uniref:LysR substrate-binding domain-containing protein n=1 Tax=Methylopila sp. Yamaguchi TaxID=1437817 RepID=UPI000CB2CEDE|nr:LysR substrate-binding domain-containing protein [Methylopila sp. Yamaguchi]GBD49796.1 LysR family transcriptional regulator [Methylopila sp. Yamaguchi]